MRHAVRTLAFALLCGSAAWAEAPPHTYMRLDPVSGVTPEAFFTTHAGELGLGPADSVQLLRTSDLQPGMKSLRYGQVHKGFRVLGAELTLSVQGGFVRSVLGRFARGLEVATDRAVDEASAVVLARRALAERLGMAPDALVLRRPPVASLAIIGRPEDAASYHLAYRVLLLTAHVPWQDVSVEVSAADGLVTALRSNAVEAWVPVTDMGTSLHDGTVVFPAEMDQQTFEHRLRAPAFHTRSFTVPGDTTQAKDVLSPTASFDQPEHGPGVSVHWATAQTFQFFEETFGVGCLKGSGTPLLSYVDMQATNSSFYPIGQYAVYGFGLGTGGALDTIGHELTHCIVMQQHPDLEAQGEVGALNESFADIFATVLELSVPDGNPVWTLGEDDFPVTGRLRDLADPHDSSPDPLPDTYEDPVLWMDPADLSNDSGGIHKNCGVQNKWFYLLSEGGAGANAHGDLYSVAGIGLYTASRVAFRNMMYGLWSQASHAAARDGAVEAAGQICGEFSQEVISTKNAWYAVGVGPGAGLPTWESQPVHQAVGVQPWPVTLRWRAGAGEEAWDVQVSTTADFSSDVLSLVSNDMLVVNAVLHGRAVVHLKPSVTYYWRVRPQTADEHLQCWRELRSFKTAANPPQLIAPVPSKVDPQKFHPWNLDFAWDEVDGATLYRLEVADSPQFTSSSLLFSPAPQVSTTTHQLDVRVNKTLYWRVRALHVDEQGVVEGSPSMTQELQTKMPGTTAQSPINGQFAHPWPVAFDWTPVVGAERFILELALLRTDVPNPFGEIQPIALPPEQTHYQRDFPGNHGNWAFQWRVRVIGPPPFDEEGTPGMGEFMLAATWTEPQLTAPTPLSCMTAEHPIEFKWQSVLHATGYAVYLRPLLCPPVSGEPCTPGVQEVGITVPAQSSPMQTHTLAGFAGPLSEQTMLGYYWDVQAFGPQGLLGYPLDYSRAYMIQPPPPTILEPAFEAEVPHGEPLTVAWSSPAVPHGSYTIQVWQGTSYCSGGNSVTLPVEGWPSGVRIIELANLDDDDDNGQFHSFRVTPSMNPCAPVESVCRKFTVKEEQESPVTEAPWVLGEYGGEGAGNSFGRMFVMFGAVPNAASYHMKIHLGDAYDPTYVGPLLNEFSFGVLQLNQIKAELEAAFGIPPLPPDVFAGFIDGTAWLTVYKWQVRGCNSQNACGPWSEWAYWYEVLPWPF